MRPIFLIILCLVTTPLMSQQTRPFTVGWLFGIERSGPVNPVDSTYFLPTESGNIVEKGKFTGTAGLRLEALLGGNATLRLDVLYADRGFIQDRQFSLSGGPIQEQEVRLRYGYLSLPFTARIPFNSGDAFMYGFAGAHADRLLFVSSSNQQATDTDFSLWAIGWKAGVGASYPFSGDSRGFFEIGFQQGISEYRMGSSWIPRNVGIVLGWTY